MNIFARGSSMLLENINQDWFGSKFILLKFIIKK